MNLYLQQWLTPTPCIHITPESCGFANHSQQSGGGGWNFVQAEREKVNQFVSTPTLAD